MGRPVWVDFASQKSPPLVGSSVSFLVDARGRGSYTKVSSWWGCPDMTPPMFKSMPRIVRSALPLVTRRAWSIRTVSCCPTNWSGRSLFVRMEWCRGAVRHSSLMRLCVASAAVATRSSLFHLGPDYASWVACWSSVSPWIADLAWNSVRSRSDATVDLEQELARKLSSNSLASESKEEMDDGASRLYHI
ncbi:hypothetical protein B296_00030158 [Ensete ventricosum]|uniref:Uncharacterized protein n=1 Tax=Ensete ventricosum TaxID=4639 RepID=A0A426Z214_ENSVE|nr:hypothetical protein B296_00030158 [Ensete ventricosum]